MTWWWQSRSGWRDKNFAWIWDDPFDGWDWAPDSNCDMWSQMEGIGQRGGKNVGWKQPRKGWFKTKLMMCFFWNPSSVVKMKNILPTQCWRTRALSIRCHGHVHPVLRSLASLENSLSVHNFSRSSVDIKDVVKQSRQIESVPILHPRVASCPENSIKAVDVSAFVTGSRCLLSLFQQSEALHFCGKRNSLVLMIIKWLKHSLFLESVVIRNNNWCCCVFERWWFTFFKGSRFIKRKNTFAAQPVSEWNVLGTTTPLRTIGRQFSLVQLRFVVSDNKNKPKRWTFKAIVQLLVYGVFFYKTYFPKQAQLSLTVATLKHPKQITNYKYEILRWLSCPLIISYFGARMSI